MSRFAALSSTMSLLKRRCLPSHELMGRIRELERELYEYQRGWPPGHFYSPIPSTEDVKARENSLFRAPEILPGIELEAEQQFQLLDELSDYYADQPFKDKKTQGLRYFFANPNFSYGEAIVLYCMMRHVRPQRIIEIGSGYSSGVILDTNQRFFNNEIECTFIEPYPQLLMSLLQPEDIDRITVHPVPIHKVEDNLFTSLRIGDMLVIDSTHVSKIGSDVNHLVFMILPALQRGVYIHFHDIYYPFEYPKQWIYEGRAWNEAYLLRAFLQYNTAFRIRFFNAFLGQFHLNRLADRLPLCAKNPGSSLWLEKV